MNKATEQIAVFWFRRDLRIEDNHALYQSLVSGKKVLPIFIFDIEILDGLDKNDARVTFIYEQLLELNRQFKEHKSGLKVIIGKPKQVFEGLLNEYDIAEVYANKDYEPYARKRDAEVEALLQGNNIKFHAFKDQVVFEENEVLKDDGKPYTIFTPYKNKWKANFEQTKHLPTYPSDQYLYNLIQIDEDLLKLSDIGFVKSKIQVKPINETYLKEYDQIRDFPAVDKTSYVSVHLRFGTISVRSMVRTALETNEIFLSELIWRSFFMQILYHFPAVVEHNFKRKYDGVQWRNNELEFEKWCNGETGYPMVDAGMRQLNETGYMHNRVRMITAGFLCKHLMIDWRWGEAYFAKKLLDYDLSANNGNWQWAAGTGCDSAPYFRIFNPVTQLKKFDKNLIYTRTWVKNFDELTYPTPMVDHKLARTRCLKAYKAGLGTE